MLGVLASVCAVCIEQEQRASNRPATLHHLFHPPALDILVPAVKAALWRLSAARGPPPLPSKHAAMVGGYFHPNTVTIELGSSSRVLLFRTGPDGQLMNLTAIPGIDPNTVLRARPVNSSQGCRWLDDGDDLELVYFEWASEAQSIVKSISFMGSRYGKLANPYASPSASTAASANSTSSAA